MLTKQTWPVYRGDQKQGARFIIEALGMTGDVAFGTTKIFIKEPKTLVALEAAREKRLGFVVAKIQAGFVHELAMFV
jgi:myosin-1